MPYAEHTKNTLVGLARERGLPTSGTKNDLVDRLSEWDTQQVLLPDEPALPVLDEPAPVEQAENIPDTRGLGDPTEPVEPTRWLPNGSNHPADGTARPVGPTGSECVVVFPLGRDGLIDRTHQMLLQATLRAAHEAGLDARGPRCVGIRQRPEGPVVVYTASIRRRR